MILTLDTRSCIRFKDFRKVDLPQPEGPIRAVMDLSDIDFMDSSGLGLILGRYNRLRGLGAELVLENPTLPIEKILCLAGVERMIPILKKDQKEKSHHEKSKDQ